MRQRPLGRGRRADLVRATIAGACIVLALALLIELRPGPSSGAQPTPTPTCVPVTPEPLTSPAPLRLELPDVTAEAAVVIDGNTGRVLGGKNEHEPRPPASTTKILTAIVALERASPDDIVTIDFDPRPTPDSSLFGLWPGAVVTMRDLLYGLMLPSGNDAAVAIARHVAGSEAAFVDLMNSKLAELGLHDSHFTNPHGLDDPNLYASAYDLAQLARYGLAKPEFAAIVGARTWYARSLDMEIENGNRLLWTYPGATGVKMGWTESAGETLVASAERDGRRVIVALLGSLDRNADGATLLDWGFAQRAYLKPGEPDPVPSPVSGCVAPAS
ncbi:MAG TPA: D-alanyl-D-alanine carboxypeptidase family protein [Dehalococcoidia bacterium]|nr:D-alanyl-D-alanine carboxypeptidase family protein [Dehalococcoidia bacterium]